MSCSWHGWQPEISLLLRSLSSATSRLMESGLSLSIGSTEAKDVVQEASPKLLKSAPGYKPTATFRTYFSKSGAPLHRFPVKKAACLL